MQIITAPCKICHKPATARFDDDAPQDAVDKWLPMLTHDRCADVMRKRIDSGSAITGACFEYYRADMRERGKMIDSTRKNLTAHTKRYAEAIAEQFNLERVIWTEHFVDLLIEQPQNSKRILENYRTEAKKQQAAGMKV